MLVAASLSTVLSTCFAAIAALGAVGAIWQTRRLHADDREDRAEEREERRTQFDAERTARLREFETEQNARASAWSAELRVRRLDQLERIAEPVAVVRQTAKDEANIEGRIGADRSAAPFFWNARKQLELGRRTEFQCRASGLSPDTERRGEPCWRP